jgi:hypothetical protein
MPEYRDSELDDEVEERGEQMDSSAPCAQKRIKPMVVALAVAFLVIVCFMICNKGRPNSARVADAFHEGPEGIANIFPQAQYPQGSVAAWRYVGQTYTCPKCSWQGTRLALDELGNCICPQCGFCTFKKNVRTPRGVDAVGGASPSRSLVKPIGIEVKDMLGGVMAGAVYENSWADKAGMKQGDIIVRFNHVDVVYVNQFQDLVAKAPPEKRVPTTVLRDGKKIKFDVWVGEGELEGVILPTKKAAANNLTAPATAAGLGQGFGRGGYAVCPGCGFRMLCQPGQACPMCPRCNNYMMSETAAANQGAAAAFQRGQGQNQWCPPR